VSRCGLRRPRGASIAGSRPDCAFSPAGVKGDRYGCMCVSREGLEHRDRCVPEVVLGSDVPIVLSLSGRYAATAWRAAELHSMVFREAVNVFSTRRERVVCGRG